MSWRGFVDEILAGLPDATEAERVVLRLFMAAVLGAVVGLDRERAGKSAGVRTHMLVALATTLYVLAAQEYGMSPSDLSRVIQGLAAGIGFIGAGTILKLAEEREITGLTTAAGIWMTAAIGVAVGLGRWGTAALSVGLTVVILGIMGRISSAIKGRDDRR